MILLVEGVSSKVGNLVGILDRCWDFDGSLPVDIIEALGKGKLEEKLSREISTVLNYFIMGWHNGTLSGAVRDQEIFKIPVGYYIRVDDSSLRNLLLSNLSSKLLLSIESLRSSLGDNDFGKSDRLFSFVSPEEI